MNSADKKYADLLKNSSSDKKEIADFFIKEASSFVKIKHYIDYCESKEDLDEIIYDLYFMSENVRSTKIVLLKKVYGFFQFKKKRLVKKFLEYIYHMQKEK